MISVHTLTLQPGVEITFWNEQNLGLFIFQMNAKCRECCSTISWNHKSSLHFHLGLTISQRMHVTLFTYYCEEGIPSNWNMYIYWNRDRFLKFGFLHAWCFKRATDIVQKKFKDLILNYFMWWIKIECYANFCHWYLNLFAKQCCI